MKHRFLTLISSLLLLTACSDSFLERAPEGNYVDVTYYTSDNALEQATAPLYNRAWFDLNSRAIVPLGSNRANDNFSRWGAPEFTNFKVTALSENLANAHGQVSTRSLQWPMPLSVMCRPNVATA